MGETLLKLGGETLTDPDQFQRLLTGRKPGETLPLTLFLAEKPLEMKIALPPEPAAGLRPAAPAPACRTGQNPPSASRLIGVEYPDVKHNPKITKEAWEFSLFSRGAPHKTNATGQPDYGSMFDYYLEQSYGKFKLEGKVFDWVEVRRNGPITQQETGRRYDRSARQASLPAMARMHSRVLTGSFSCTPEPAFPRPAAAFTGLIVPMSAMAAAAGLTSSVMRGVRGCRA